jgi:hypothetical protein
MHAPTLSSNAVATRSSPKILIPYDVREAISVACAARIAGKSETTVRTWCRRHHIGRHVGGAWAVSRVALAMLLEGDLDALAAYHDGARAQYEPVARHYSRLGLGELLKRADFGA